MQKTAFRLHTTPDSFVQLLSDLTRFVPLRKFAPRFPTKHKGYFSLKPARLAMGKADQGLITLNMMCSYILEG